MLQEAEVAKSSAAPPDGAQQKALAKDLEEWNTPDGILLLQYVDDLLIAAVGLTPCLQATVSLLNFVGLRGYRVARSKAQIALSEFANETMAIEKSLNSELYQLRLLALQNRQALDYVLASQGGTLDPDTAHPNLVVSEDRKRVRHGDKRQDLPDNPERFDRCFCVLGTEGFMGGRRYWEVEVRDKIEWHLGVCRESVSRKGWITPTPEDGYWVVWLRGGEYKACTSPSTPLSVSVRPSRVGIFLDYEAGEVSFYNMTDRSHLFTFTGTFSGTLRPYFYPGYNLGSKNAAPLIISPVPAQAGGSLCPLR
ncbi:E3 ubiquitin-protein ligase TRIM39-like [Mauremys mutica]|uniref:E3 ubiquitin-protein ligase TRIM39-like n=1 Tax=Mauremys mutica TaxID=74926 RepID=UPI001D169D41|nr:E3 ubiquitin-protein ligase TRIM39-like [Mauremys mutica]